MLVWLAAIFARSLAMSVRSVLMSDRFCSMLLLVGAYVRPIPRNIGPVGSNVATVLRDAVLIGSRVTADALLCLLGVALIGSSIPLVLR